MPPDELSSQPVELVVDQAAAGTRLDAFLAARFPAHSRVHLRRVINAAGVLVDGRRAKAAHRLHGGERIAIHLPDLPRTAPVAEDIPLEILYEDATMAAVNKPPGMVVHPGKGHWSGTLAAALQHHFDTLSAAGGPARPGIVHRLDRDTSGVLVVAKNDRVHLALAGQFEQRTVEKEYTAIVVGAPDRDRDRIDRPIGVHPYQREKMAIRQDHNSVRQAETFYEVAERLDGMAVLRVVPKTGRTHQIRVHLAHVGLPVLCDRLYSGRARLTLGELTGDTVDQTVLLERQALHARRLVLSHPESGQRMELIAPVPEDMTTTLDALRKHRRAGGRV